MVSYVPTGKPRGRRPGLTKAVLEAERAERAANPPVLKFKKPDGRKNNGAHLRVPDELKKKKAYIPTGKPRGRRKGQTNAVLKAERAAKAKAKAAEKKMAEKEE